VVRGTFFEHNVPVSSMFVHFRTEPDGYARPLRMPRVNKLVSEWDAQAVGVLLLSMRNDGRMAVIDGQHRKEAAHRMGVTHMNALVYIDLTIEDEARLYRKFGDYLKQTALDRFHAGLTEGVPAYQEIASVIVRQGLHIPHSTGNTTNKVVAVDALITVHRVYGLGILSQTIGLLHDAWAGEPRAYRAMVVTGTAAFLARFSAHPNYNHKRLVQRMTRQGVSALERRAWAIRDGSLASNPNFAWGQALLGLHDFREPEGSELGEWPRRHFTEQAAASLGKRMASYNASLTPEQRSERATKANQVMTPEARSERAKRGIQTRKGYSDLEVICTYCNAMPGYPCCNSQGGVLDRAHKGRREQAAAKHAA